MQKKIISLAVAASVLGGAAGHAGQYVNPDKTGQVLLFPFYNAENENITNMHIVNTTGAAKAVKVRVLEYKNSDVVLNFNLYLAKYDEFAFGVIAGDVEGAQIVTADNSCTWPPLGTEELGGRSTSNSDGSTTLFQPLEKVAYETDADSTIGRTLTGHVEVIEMGVLTDGSTAATNATPDATGVLANCGAFETYNGAGLGAPEGGLYGLASHINAVSSSSFGFEATAIDDWSTGAAHTAAGSSSPTVATGVGSATIQTSAGATRYADISVGNGAQAASAVLMTETLSNDVMLNPIIGGTTDWVVTFPTKKAHVDNETAVAPFTDNWVGGPSTESPACETVSVTQYDREGQTPAAAAAASICNSVAVIAMGPAGTESSLGVTTGLTTMSSPYTEGWQSMVFGTSEARNSMTVGGYTMTGLPAIGFAAYKISAGAMSYGNTVDHRTASCNVLSSASDNVSSYCATHNVLSSAGATS